MQTRNKSWFGNHKLWILLVSGMLAGLMLAACGDSTTVVSQVPTTTAALPSPTATTAATTAPGTTLANLPTVTPVPTTAAPATTAAPVETTAAPTTVAQTTAPATTTAAPATTAAPTPTPTTAAPTATVAPATATVPPSPPPAVKASSILYTDAANKLWSLDPASKAKTPIDKVGSATKFALSPDAGTLLVAGQVGGQSGLFRMDMKSGQVGEIKFDGQAAGEIEHLRFTADGNTILIGRVSGKANSPERGDGTIWLVNANGQNLRKLADGYAPAWSNDGKRIAFVTNNGASIRLVNSEGKNEFELLNKSKIPTEFPNSGYPFRIETGDNAQIQSPAFVDGGKKVAFSLTSAGVVLSANSTDGKNIQLWLGNPEGGYGVVKGNPGSSLMLVEGYPPSGYSTLEILDSSAAPRPDQPQGVRFGGPRDQANVLQPVWSPDGKRVAFIQTAGEGGGPPEGPITGTLVVASIVNGKLEITKLLDGSFRALAWSAQN